jgi:hypothetical protein
VGVNDSSEEARNVQHRVLSKMSPARKILLLEDANRTARRLALAGIQSRFPRATREQQIRLLMDIVLGPELATRVYGPRPTGIRK